MHQASAYMRDILSRYPRPGPGDLLLLAPVFSVRVCFITGVSRSGDTELYRAGESCRDRQ